MKKGVYFFAIILLLISAGAFAETITKGAVSQEVSDYLETFVGKGGISEGQIETINEIDKNSLPDGVEIKNINDNKVGIYELNYTDGVEKKSVFVVTYASQDFKKPEFVSFKNLQYLQFGYSKSSSISDYLETATGVKSGDESGYVMMRSGSITGISTNLDFSGEGLLNIKIYKNGEDTGFGNLISSEDKKKIDFDLQSENIITYQPGDLISVYVEQSGQIDWENVITMVEITG